MHKDVWGPSSDAINTLCDAICHIEAIPRDDAPGRKALSRLIDVNWITCSCLHHNAAQNHMVGFFVGLFTLLFIATRVPSLQRHIFLQTAFVLCQDKNDS